MVVVVAFPRANMRSSVQGGWPALCDTHRQQLSRFVSTNAISGRPSMLTRFSSHVGWRARQARRLRKIDSIVNQPSFSVRISSAHSHVHHRCRLSSARHINVTSCSSQITPLRAVAVLQQSSNPQVTSLSRCLPQRDTRDALAPSFHK